MSKNSLLKKFTSAAVAGAMSFSMIPALAQINTQTVSADTAPTPYEEYGDVQIKNIGGKMQLCDESGNPVQLRGMSTFGLQWGQGSWVLNDDAFDVLANDWECDIIRLAMYVSETGYHDSPEVLLDRVETGIELATERGMYVLVDWHILNEGTNDPTSDYCNEAGADIDAFSDIRAEHPEYTGPQLFFAYLSEKYGDQGNVLFETANEPNGLTKKYGSEAAAWDVLKGYHEGVVDAIRTYDADENPNIVICGTDNWSQFVDSPAANPVVDPAVEAGLADVDQIAYTFHFYSGTHDVPTAENPNWLKDKVMAAIEGGVAVFCTEWGTSEASGDEGPYIDYSQAWIDFMAENDISWCSWSLARKGEISAALQPTANTNPDGAWDPETDLTITGNFVRAMIKGLEAPMIGSQEIVVDFDTLNENSGAAVDSNNAVYPGYTLVKTTIADGNNALLIPEDDTGAWDGPRVTFADLGTQYSIYTGMIFTLYSETAQDISITSIIQTEATGWWNPQGDISISASSWTLDEATGLYMVKIDKDLSNVPAGDKLGHITLLFGEHSDLYIDDIGFSSLYNGDISRAPVIPDNPGTFMGMPFDFEEGGRQGWKPNEQSAIDYTTIDVVEVTDGNHAMVFPVVMSTDPTDANGNGNPDANEWESGVRLGSPMGIMTYEDSVAVNAFEMDLYIEADKATTGAMQLEIMSIPNGDGFWYQSGSFNIDFSAGEVVEGTNLLHYAVQVPLNNQGFDAGYPFSEGVAIRNIILALHNATSDYSGNVYYDNIRYTSISDSEVETGWVKNAEGKWMYIGEDGEAVTGWMKDTDSKWYYMNEDGIMLTGWQEIDGTWYYLKGSGAMATGWQKLGGVWYYLNGSGAMVTGWQKLGGVWYYFKASGAMATGWVKDGNTWYYMNESGAMATGWREVSGKWYYFYDNGAMAYNTTINGYTVDANGVWVR